MKEAAEAWASDGEETHAPSGGAPSGGGETLPGVQDPLVGRLLDTRYRIDALLGRGGMGAVYRGEQVFLRRPVAVKVLHPAFATTPEFVERFRREAEIAVKLRSPHVVDVLDFGQAEGRFYLVMELLEGESLQAALRRQQRFPPGIVETLLRQLLAGLRAVHAAGIVHRDLKPDNLWLVPGPDGSLSLRILDFGIARMPVPEGAAQTRAGIVMGTPEYLSPEQALGRVVDRRADLYSVGIIAWVLLTGRHPFATGDAQSLLAAHAMAPMPSLLDVAPELAAHPRLVELVTRATQKDPDARPADVDALLALLGPAIEAEAPTRLSAAPAAPVPSSLTSPRHETIVALKSEGHELLEVSRTALKKGGEQAVAATLGTALWVTRLTRWLLLALGAVWNALTGPRTRAAIRGGVEWTVRTWRFLTTTERGRRVGLAGLVAVAALAGAGAWWWMRPVNAAARAIARGQPGVALTLLADTDPKDVDALVLRGRAQARMERHPEALTAFRSAAALDAGVWKRDDVLEELGLALGGARSKDAADLLVNSGESALDVLEEASRDAKSYRRRWAAIDALKRLGKEDRADLVLAYLADLENDDCDVSKRAARKLGELGDVRAIEPLRAAGEKRGVLFEGCAAESARVALRKLQGRQEE